MRNQFGALITNFNIFSKADFRVAIGNGHDSYTSVFSAHGGALLPITAASSVKGVMVTSGPFQAYFNKNSLDPHNFPIIKATTGITPKTMYPYQQSQRYMP
mmetsp:Transcript_31346/g.48836  ORF Transcript_31346/g.48836 Transcript_31346/m.48836 type:complete len:101 (-) Transcript_31346:763-1065(-)